MDVASFGADVEPFALERQVETGDPGILDKEKKNQIKRIYIKTVVVERKQLD